MRDFTPKTGKLELHLTYRCDLGCLACSRESYLSKPHTPDMTLEDLEELFKQADAIGWRQMKTKWEGERPRIIIIGGEPTRHSQFLEFVKRATEWSQNYVQVYSNGYSESSRELCERARLDYSASICTDEWKTHRRVGGEEGEAEWHLGTSVSPTEAGIPFAGICYCHSSDTCGIGVDHDGYSLCPIGCSIAAVLGLPVRTKNLADLFDVEKAFNMTLAMCSDCGYAVAKRAVTNEDKAKFEEYVKSLPKFKGTPVSPMWEKALNARR